MASGGSTVGKRVREALYVHRDALGEIAAAKQQAVASARAISGDFQWNVVRIEPGKIAFLEYDDFEREHFPALRRSLLVDLAKREAKLRDFSSSENPPILHRKEELLPSDHPRRLEYAALTASLEALGLFAENHKIGHRKSWQQRLAGAEITIQGHRIVQKPAAAVRIQVERHKTAIPRNRLSSPMHMLAKHGFLEAHPDVFDYGCGQGDDLRVLADAGISAAGWDPYFRPDEQKRSADLVNLGFVLNVVEDAQERGRVLQDAWSLCRKIMAVAVMVEGHYSVQGLKPLFDGYLTSRGTFQKYYTPHELRAFVRQVLNTEPVAVAPGIVFVFRDPEAEQEFLFRRRRRTSPTGILFARSSRPASVWIKEPLSGRLRPVLEQLWSKAVELGRPPERDETPELVELLARSNVSVARAMDWCRSAFDDHQLETSAIRKKDDLLVHFALGAVSGSRSFNSLPLSLQRDVRCFFKGFGGVQSEARRFLFSLGTTGPLEEACGSAVRLGRIHPCGEHRFHFDARQTEELPAALRTLVGCAGVLVGDADDASLVAMNLQKRSVAFYFSPDFGGPLTLFTRATTVYLRNQHVHDQILTDDQRLLFLHSSLYEKDPSKRERRAILETRLRSALGNSDGSWLTARYGEVATTTLRQH
jgi:DNA phosphorothioation-associated putative methyltransferase